MSRPRRHVGGDEQLGGARPDPAHHPVSLLLAHAAMQRLGAVAATVHRLGQLIHLVAGATEHDRCGRRLDVEHPAERSGLV